VLENVSYELAKQKTHDIEKIGHYAEPVWTMSNGKVIKNDG